VRRRRSLAAADLEERSRGNAVAGVVRGRSGRAQGRFTHWVAWGLEPGAGGLGGGEAAPVEGRNDFGTSGYRGPCLPPGHGRHRYVFRLYALDVVVDPGSGADRGKLERAIEEHVLTTAELVGTYER
jgi:Raf kinase inhibitor-like YbhB/YbcL family protein